MELILNFILGTIALSRNNLLQVIPVLHKDWSVSVEVNPSGTISDWSTILRVGIGGDIGVYGDRTPTLFFSAGTTSLYVTSSVNNNRNYYYDTGVFPINTWTKLDVSQSLQSDGYHFTISKDDNVVHDTINAAPQDFSNVNVSSS